MDGTIELQGLRALRFKLRRAEEAVASNPQLMGQIGAYLMFAIKARTGEGEDAQGRSFRPYTEEYAEYRSANGLPTADVDLFFTGSMMSSMTFKASSKSVRLFFMNTTDDEGVRNPAKAYYNQMDRDFFSISADEVEVIEKMVKEWVDSHLVRG